MNLMTLRKALALASLTAMTACGGGGSSGGAVPAGNGGNPGGQPLLSRIVGVGDSLTAGYQAGGMLGATGVPDPLFPGLTVPPTQEQGWWADVDEQASGLPLSQAIANEFDPNVSPLPLIAGPGINNELVPALGLPFEPEKQGNACADDGGFNAAGYLLTGSKRVRMNPFSTTIRNVAVPGITLHEANMISQPQSNTCKALPGIRGLLQQVVDGESSTYWPVLRNWSFMNSKLTMVNAGAQLKPTLALVWLGANDVLKFMGSGGLFRGGDSTPGQAAADVRQAIGTLKHAGAHVVAANLPNILETPYFMRVTIPSRSICARNIQTYVACVFQAVLQISPAVAAGLTAKIALQYHLATPSGCEPTSLDEPCGYLTLQGTFAIIQYYHDHGKLPDLDNGKPGSGLGMFYITPAFAAQVQALNTAVNDGIATAAQNTSTPLVDVASIFSGIASGDPSNPYFRMAIGISRPNQCCTLGFEGGLVSFDGLHPSNTGYALLAYAFIATINGAYGARIPQIDVKAAYAGTRCSNTSYCYPDPYAPPCAQNPALCGPSSSGIIDRRRPTQY